MMNEKLDKTSPKKTGNNVLEDMEALRGLSVKKIIELNKNINLNELTPVIKAAALESFKIESQYKKYKVNYNDAKLKLTQTDAWLTEDEFKQIEKEELTLDKSISELNSNLENIDLSVEKVRLKEIEKLIEYKSDLLVDENFNKNHKLAAKFLKKLVIDHINLEMFGKKEKYKGKIIEKMRDDKAPGLVYFLYFNSNPMETIKTTKVSHLIDGNGTKLKIEEIYQSNEIFSKLISVNNKQVRIRVPIYFGTIVCGDSND